MEMEMNRDGVREREERERGERGKGEKTRVAESRRERV